MSDTFDTSHFSEEDRQRAREESKTVDFHDASTLLLFGTAQQGQLGSLLDAFIGDLGEKEAVSPVQLLADLEAIGTLMKIGQIRERLNGVKPGFAARTFGGALDLAGLMRHLAENQDKILERLDALRTKAASRQRAVLARGIRMSALRPQLEERITALAVSIAGGEMALQRGLAEHELLLRHSLDSDANSLANARLRDLAVNLTRFTARLRMMREAHDRALAVTMTTFRGMQHAGADEAGSIVDTLLVTVPRIKQMTVQAASLSEGQLAQRQLVRRLADEVEALQSAARGDSTGP